MTKYIMASWKGAASQKVGPGLEVCHVELAPKTEKVPHRMRMTSTAQKKYLIAVSPQQHFERRLARWSRPVRRRKTVALPAHGEPTWHRPTMTKMIETQRVMTSQQFIFYVRRVFKCQRVVAVLREVQFPVF